MDKKSIYIIVAVVIIVVGIWFWMNQSTSNAPTEGTSQGSAVMESDSTASINQDLNNIAVQESDFNSIDADVNSL